QRRYPGEDALVQAALRDEVDHLAEPVHRKRDADDADQYGRGQRRPRRGGLIRLHPPRRRLPAWRRHGRGGVGRYDNLATSGTDRFPGVGISIGVTRILGLLFGSGALSASRAVPTCVLVALPDEESRPACDRIAGALRRRGIA